jgi:hypothetical protein
MEREKSVFEATTEIVVTAMSTRSDAIQKRYADEIAEFAEIIYKKLNDLKYKGRD